AVWRFHRYDRPALGLGSLEDYFAAYEAESGVTVDRERFRYWLIHRTVWWALGCLKMAQIWRSGEDRMLERVVISRRTSEQELDLLMLLEEDAPEEERERKVSIERRCDSTGEASIQEVVTAVSEWLATLKDRMEGHDRFQLAVARNALGIVGRDASGTSWQANFNSDATSGIFEGGLSLSKKDHLFLAKLYALEKVGVDSPKYPALAVARERWL
ncbi:MAG: phosphotransferase family protein, partial [Pseudomonadota bacterium]